MCNMVSQLWSEDFTTDQVLDIAIAGFCMNWPEITNDNLAKYFPQSELNSHHIYVNSDEAAVINPNTDVVLFGNSKVDITINSDEKKITVWILDNSSATVKVSENALVVIDLIGEGSFLNVEGNSKRVTKVFKR